MTSDSLTNFPKKQRKSKEHAPHRTRHRSYIYCTAIVDGSITIDRWGQPDSSWLLADDFRLARTCTRSRSRQVKKKDASFEGRLLLLLLFCLEKKREARDRDSGEWRQRCSHLPLTLSTGE